jgi:pyruvate,water dikinase
MIYTKEYYTIDKIGGKAGALAKLSRIADNIPAWFAIGIEGASKEDIALALQKFDDDILFAVRSSTAVEDGSDHSFAGQFETYLNIPKSKICENITKVQNSVYSERVETYKRERGIEITGSSAVLVQQMVKADCAGVAFGANPVTGNTKECVINAVSGLGDKLVDGSVDADTYIVTGDIVAGEGVLTHEQCREIAALCKITSRFFGCYQDIEWAYENNKLYLLQSRPITSLRKFIGKSGYINIWDNSNIAESYNGVTTPLTFSFIRLAYEHVYREMCRMLGVSEKKIIENDYIFTHMLGLCDGQVYYNLLSWYKLVAILPGYKTNAKFMEQMMGVKEGLQPEVRKLLPPPSDATIYTAVKRLWKHHRRNEQNVAQFFNLLNRTIKSRDLSDYSLFELAQYYRELESKLLKNWDAPVINDFFSMIFYGLLKNTSKNWCGIEDENKFNGLLRNTGDIISAEPARLVREMAEMKVRGEDISEKMAQYLDKFGDRCINELKLESETLTDNPNILYNAIDNYAIKLNSGDVQIIKDDFDEREIINKAGFKKPIFKWILKNARRTIRNRENLRFERTRVFGTVRGIFKEIGMRLASFKVIDERDDIFYLELGEVLAYIEGTATTLNLRGLAEVRKKEFATFERLTEDRFETYDCVNLSQRHFKQHDNTMMSENTLTGLGCCPGIVRGRARVITEPKDAVIYPGEILVAQRTDPGWIMLFPVAAGVLVEYGSLLSHAAIVVREMGIPAVVSVKNLFAHVETGDLLELDGEKGLITIIEKRK